MRFGWLPAILLFLSGMLFAQTTQLQGALEALCGGLTSLVPVASMVMVILGAVVYAGGQIMGAETRARANVWATACLTGAVIGTLIVSIAPGVLGLIYGGGISCGAGAGGGGGGGGGGSTPNCGFTLTCGGATPYCCDRTSCCLGFSCASSPAACSCGTTAC